MLQTIEVEIDAHGVIRPLEPIPVRGKVRGLLTFLSTPTPEQESLTVKQPEIDSLFGIARATRPVSLEEMDAVIRKRGGAA